MTSGISTEIEGDVRDPELPPHSLQAEEAVLGAILKVPSSIARVADLLRPEYFYAVRNHHIFRAMLALFKDGVPIDYHATADRLVQMGVYEAAGGLMYLSEISLATPAAAHIEHYARIVQRTYVCRRAISAAQSI